jgi:hypothetical protein
MCSLAFMRRSKVLSALAMVGLTLSASQATTIQHVAGHSAGWKDGASVAVNWARIRRWPASNADGTIGEFDKAAIQAAINAAKAARGAYDAKVKVTQVNWVTDPVPADLAPIVASADMDTANVTWGSANAYSAGAGSWTYNGTTYASFSAAVLAGTASGESVVAAGMPWQAIWNTTEFAAPVWDIVIDVPESMIEAFLANPDAKILFVGAERLGTDGREEVFYGDQWGERANIRLAIDVPPQTAPWIALSTFSVDQVVALTDPVAPVQTVTVTDGGSGTLAWTAAESPDVPWLTLMTPTGGPGSSFGIAINVTGQTPGTYSTTVQVADPTAGNTPQTVVVRVTVLETATPVIALDRSSISLSIGASAAAPTVVPVKVTNAGMGSLNWTATVQGSPAWLSVTNASGIAGGSFNVNVDQTKVVRGSYSANIEVAAPGAANSPQVLPVNLEVRDQDANYVVANGYDDAWENGPNGWVQYCRTIKAGFTGTAGFVVHLGDSISYANQYGRWAHFGDGKTAEDVSICNWMHSNDDWERTDNITDNGWYLTAHDMPGGRSYTAESGIRADQYISGGADLPSLEEMFDPAGPPNPDGKKYTDAQIAVIMLGTNDSGSRTAAAVAADLDTIANRLLANNTIVILSTIPPRRGKDATIVAYNDAIRALAQTKRLPLIDFYAEILRRRPGNSWDGTLIQSDGVHPTASSATYSSSSSPYLNNGEPLGEVGYLLRGWLSVQKIKEVYDKVVADQPQDTTPPAAIGNLAGGNATAASVDLTWTAPGDDGTTGWAVSYDLRYSTGTITAANWASATQVQGEPLPQVAGTSQGMTVQDLSAGTTYYFAIKTTDDANNVSALSNVPSVTTLPPHSTPPTAPTGVVAVAVSTSGINVSWAAASDPQSGIDHYVIYRGGKRVATSSASPFSDTGLSSGRSYVYEVAAVNGAGIEGPRSAPAGATTIVAPGDMIAWWALDESSGTIAADTAAAGSNGTVVGGAAWTTGPVGGALSFDGVDDRVDGAFKATLNMAGPASVSLWVYSVGVPGSKSVFGYAPTSAAVILNIYASGSVRGYGDSVVVSSSVVPPANTWYHLAYTFDGTTHRIYLNGQERGTNTLVPAAAPVTLFRMGDRVRFGSRIFTGSIDDVRVFGRALSVGEINAMYQVTPSNSAPTVDAGDDQQIALAGVAGLDGTISDDGWPVAPGAVTVAWSKVSGPGDVTFADPAGVDTAATFSAAGTYVLKLEADDGDLVASDTVTVVVTSQNAAPTVDAGSSVAVYEGRAVSLHATATDPDSDPLDYLWTQTAGASATLSGAATADASFTAPVIASLPEADLLFHVSVSDGRGGQADDTISVRVYMLGDTNDDDSVDVVDLLTFVAAFGSYMGDANFDPQCDLYPDGGIDVVDLLTFVANFGRVLE